MARLVIFVAFCSALGWVLSFSGFKRITPDNTKFNLDKAQKQHQEHLTMLEKMNNPVEEKVEDTQEKPKLVELVLDTPQLKRGHQVYFKKGKCATCHGKNGEGKKSQKAPRLAKQYDWYVVKQLKDMKSGVRYNAKMNPYLKNLNEQDFEDVAHYLSKLQAQPL